MADQMKWARLWVNAAQDPALLALPRELRWAWVGLLLYTRAHGTKGTLEIADSAAGLVGLAASMGTTVEQIHEELSKLPHVVVRRLAPEPVVKVVNDRSSSPDFGLSRAYGRIAVTFSKWRKYQEDSTVSERVSRLRARSYIHRVQGRDGSSAVSPNPQRPCSAENHPEGSDLRSWHYRCPGYSGPPVDAADHGCECKCGPCMKEHPGPRSFGNG